MDADMEVPKNFNSLNFLEKFINQQLVEGREVDEGAKHSDQEFKVDRVSFRNSSITL